jgi:hypothetical protein
MQYGGACTCCERHSAAQTLHKRRENRKRILRRRLAATKEEKRHWNSVNDGIQLDVGGDAKEDCSGGVAGAGEGVQGGDCPYRNETLRVTACADVDYDGVDQPCGGQGQREGVGMEDAEEHEADCAIAKGKEGLSPNIAEKDVGGE